MNPILATIYSPAELEAKYPKRQEGVVTRFAPSPTGFLHIGGLYAALISERFSHQTNGTFILRIEDTDKKREVAGAAELIHLALEGYGISVDEGPVEGPYGPYVQSQRAAYYATYVQQLLDRGLAYPCFCSTEELETIRFEQEAKKVRPGYWGEWARWRDQPEVQVEQALLAGRPYVIRLRSSGDITKRLHVEDAVKGALELPENDQDVVLLKADGLPTYHLAHVVDDHLMRTTHVLRADEWLSSLSLHLQLFEVLGFETPIFGHISPIQKMEGQSKRKLSKRKDPEANIDFYTAEGYPVQAVIEYLMTLVNSGFEDWRRQHQGEDSRIFRIALNQISKSGALFDFVKLNSVSQEVIASLTADEAYSGALGWAQRFDPELATVMAEDGDYAVKVFGIERGDAKARKDIAKWSDIRPEFGFFFDSIFNQQSLVVQQLLDEASIVKAQPIIDDLLRTYDPSDTREVWFEKLQSIAKLYGYAESFKLYKADPSAYAGHVGDVAKLLRISLTGRLNSPDLSQVMRTMGIQRVTARLHAAIS